MNIRDSKSRSALGLGALGATVSGSSFAALPAVVGTELTTVQTDALAAIDLVWPVVMAVLGGFVIMKVVKRFAGKI